MASTTTAPTTTTAPATTSPAGEDSRSLARTGLSSGLPWLVGLGVLVLGVGVTLAFASRKRRTKRS